MRIIRGKTVKLNVREEKIADSRREEMEEHRLMTTVPVILYLPETIAIALYLQY